MKELTFAQRCSRVRKKLDRDPEGMTISEIADALHLDVDTLMALAGAWAVANLLVPRDELLN